VVVRCGPEGVVRWCGGEVRAGGGELVWCGGEVRAGGGELVRCGGEVQAGGGELCGVVVRCGPEGAS
jgi:hypothetical protein